MTDKEKAKAYDEAIKRAKQLYVDGMPQISRNTTEYIFPELKESEDEKIRKELIDYHRSMAAQADDYVHEAWIAWIEKQGEQKPAEWSEDDNEHVESILERLEGMCKKGATFTTTRFAVNQDIDWLKSLKERIEG